ncbi:hypothetical protein KEM54_004156 [Ascosphaera aggregata]|nr:hypothetical protein KEM54_004156 [Ascosphaera aggregata]
MKETSNSASDSPADKGKEKARSGIAHGSSRQYEKSSSSLSEYGIHEDWELRYSTLDGSDISDDVDGEEEEEEEEESEESDDDDYPNHRLVIEELSDAERAWTENMEQLQQLITFLLIPFLGKYLGRKCAYWGWDKFMQWKYPVELQYRPNFSRATGFVKTASPL